MKAIERHKSNYGTCKHGKAAWPCVDRVADTILLCTVPTLSARHEPVSRSCAAIGYCRLLSTDGIIVREERREVGEWLRCVQQYTSSDVSCTLYTVAETPVERLPSIFDGVIFVSFSVFVRSASSQRSYDRASSGSWSETRHGDMCG